MQEIISAILNHSHHFAENDYKEGMNFFYFKTHSKELKVKLSIN